MKTCVFITGTNSSGKSTAAREILRHFGGCEKIEKDITYAANTACFVGRYKDGGKSGGVDTIPTKLLREKVCEGFASRDVVICEGSYMDTFGLNLQTALFAGQRAFVFVLYAPPAVLKARLDGRGGSHTEATYKKVLDRQRRVLASAKKWASIGVAVKYLDSSQISPAQIAAQIINTINKD